LPVKIDRFLIQGNEDIDLFLACHHFLRSKADRKRIMSSADPRLIGLGHMDGISAPHQALRKEVAHGLQSLSCLAPDQDILKHPRCPLGGSLSSFLSDGGFSFHVALSLIILIGNGLSSGQLFHFSEKIRAFSAEPIPPPRAVWLFLFYPLT